MRPPLSRDVRRELTAVYRSEIVALQGLIGRDQSHWLKDGR